MKTITIDGKEYDFITEAADINLGDYTEIIKILSQREIKDLGKMATSDERLTEIVDVDKESADFKRKKMCDLVAFLSGVNREMFDEYPTLVDTLAELVDLDAIITDPEPAKKELECYGVKYKVTSPSEGTFQQWCDLENFVSDNPLIVFIVYLQSGDKYNRYHPDFEEKMVAFSRLPVIGHLNTLSNLLSEASKIRSEYKFVYSEDDTPVEPAGRAIQEHSQRFKWEDVIATIAETPVFNSRRGTLWAVRNAPVLEVLDYLNLKRSKDLAEYKDYKAKNSKDSKTL